jgi:hypothetical protein
MLIRNYFRVSVFAVCMLCIFGCGDNQPSAENRTDDERNVSPPLADPSLSMGSADTVVKVFVNDLPSTGYGYDILMNGKLYIHQPNIPAVPGNGGFSSEKNAYKTAVLVLYKIRNNIMPPRIDVKELDSLGVLK